MENLQEINGNEIIDFLNSLSDDEHEELFDVSCSPPYTFEKQKIDNDKYTLKFSAIYNNWGTDQEIDGNCVYITKDNLWLGLSEPFDGDSSSDVLKKILTTWISKHKFSTDNKEKYESKIEDSRELLTKVSYGDIDILDEVIKNLTEAKTLIK